MRKWLSLFIIMLSYMQVTGFAYGDDINKHASCKYCGMDREKFGHARMLLEYDDGTAEGTCSVHCAAIDLSLNIDKTPKAIWVGDLHTRKLVDAETASWVIVEGKPGVMTQRAKWAFASKQDAETYIRENGGSLVSFDEVMKAAYEDMYKDTKMIREKRKMKRMKH